MNRALKLFTNPACPYCHRVEIVLAEKKLPVERVTIPLGGEPTPAWYKELNPRETVPTLQVDGKELVYESNLIASYLDKIGGGNLLAGTTPLQRYNVQFFSTQIPTLTRAASAYLRNPLDEQCRSNVDEAAMYLNGILDELQTTGPFVCDEQFTLADVMLVPFLDRFYHSLRFYCCYNIFAKAPLLKRLWQASMARPSVRDTALTSAQCLKAYVHYVPDNVPMKAAQGKYTLFGLKVSQYTNLAALACAAKNIKPQLIEVNVGQPPAWFLHLNPRGTIPVLVTPDGNVIHESRAIARYVDEVSKEGNRLTNHNNALKEYAADYFAQCAEELTGAGMQLLQTPDSKDARSDLQWCAKELVKQLESSPFGSGPFHGGAHMHIGDIALLAFLNFLRALMPELTNGYDLFAEFPALDKLLRAGLETPEAHDVFAKPEAYLGVMKMILQR